MKKLLSLITGTLVTLSVVAVPVGAQTCEISQTGPNSVNTCTFDETTEIKVTCNNGINTNFTNEQIATSGNATVEGNTISGNATTGDAENINETTVKLASYCATTAVVTPTPETPVEPGVVAAASTTATPKAAVLPETGQNQAVKNGVITVAAVGLLTLIAQLGSMIAQRVTTKQ